MHARYWDYLAAGDNRNRIFESISSIDNQEDQQEFLNEDEAILHHADRLFELEEQLAKRSNKRIKLNLNLNAPVQ